MKTLDSDTKATLELMLPKDLNLEDYLSTNQEVKLFILGVIKLIEAELEHNRKIHKLNGKNLHLLSATNIINDFKKVIRTYD